MTSNLLIANVMSPVVMFLPGFYIHAFYLGFLYSMLAAIIERPFVQRAGVSRSPLVYSIRANTISHLVGFIYSVFAIMLFLSLPRNLFGFVGFVLIIIGAVALSVIVEVIYLRSKTSPKRGPFRIGYIVAGNVISPSVIVGLGWLIAKAQTIMIANGEWVGYLFKLNDRAIQIPLNVAAIAIAIFMLFSFLLPVKKEESEEHGGEEGCDDKLGEGMAENPGVFKTRKE